MRLIAAIMRPEITQLFEEVGRHYEDREVAELDLHQGHDVHAFYRLSADPSKVVHVQGYAWMSSDNEARVWARMMDYDKMIEIRREGGVSIGNEHEATTQEFPNFETGINIPYDSRVLEDKLAEHVPELR